VLAALGGLASLVVARWTLQGALAILPGDTGAVLHAELRAPILLFAAAMAVGTGLLFGFFPALHSTRPDLASTIRANTGQLSSARASTRFRTVLIGANRAVDGALISAGLFIKSLAAWSHRPRFTDRQRRHLRHRARLNGYAPSRRWRAFQQTERRLRDTWGDERRGIDGTFAHRQQLGTDAVEDSSTVPMSSNTIQRDQRRLLYAGAILAGREFTATTSPARRVAIVNGSSRKFNLGGTPSGDGARSDEEPRRSDRRAGAQLAYAAVAKPQPCSSRRIVRTRVVI
jgi:hypothetical protein